MEEGVSCARGQGDRGESASYLQEGQPLLRFYRQPLSHCTARTFFCSVNSRRACPKPVEGTCSAPFNVVALPQSPPNHPFTSITPVPKSQKRISLRNCGLIQPAGKRRHEAMQNPAPKFFLGLSLGIV